MGYFQAARHPLPSLLVFLPVLAGYELGVAAAAGPEGADAYRNGVDLWLRQWFAAAGVKHPAVVPALAAWPLAVWAARRWGDRPGGLAGVCLGVAFESVLLALALFAAGTNLGPMLDAHQVRLDATALDPDAARRLLTSVGAGVYEEVVFRLVLYAGLAALLQYFLVPDVAAVGLAALGSATAFAAAHHVGPGGEALDGFVFLFRCLAGLFFAAVFQTRGFGVAVGSHAGYDLLAGLG